MNTGTTGAKTPNTQPPDINLSTAPTAHTVDPEKTSMIVTILLLVFSYPLGVLVMWLWPKWSKVVKIIITLPMILGILALIGFAIFVAAAPKKVTVTLNNTTVDETLPKSSKSDTGNRPNPFGSMVNSEESTPTANPESQTEINQETTAECKFDSDCTVGKCIMIINGPDVCSEGKLGQACFLSMDCQTNHCGKGKCTEGKAGDPCDTMLGCEGSLDCKNEVCQ